jgi:hypothetical protein
MVSVNKTLKRELDANIPYDNQYEYIKSVHPYTIIWDINRELLELSGAYSTLININNEDR